MILLQFQTIFFPYKLCGHWFCCQYSLINYSDKLRNENQKTVIKTDDLDVNQPKETNREYAVPGQIKRDTAAIAGGKQVQYKLSKKNVYV